MEKINHIHSIDANPNMTTSSVSTKTILMIIVAAIVLGVGTGYAVNYFQSPASPTANNTSETTEEGEGNKQSAGVLDKSTFTDQAEGVLKEGGFEGEGSFHLDRPGGDDQNVYLTSTAVDLSEFLGKKVKVWGKTYEAEKAGWLMDVGYIEIVK